MPPSGAAARRARAASVVLPQPDRAHERDVPAVGHGEIDGAQDGAAVTTSR
ncbi:MAG: hypothetical protein ACLSHG_00405 [Oscillospiraceae bacterium]